MLKEFREFIMRGNVIDLAVGVIMGTAFGGIIDSLVRDIIMPPIGMVLGGVDFAELYLNLTRVPYQSLSEATEAGAATINYGIFLNTIINFLIIAFAMFMLVKGINRLFKSQAAKPEPEPVTPAPDVQERLISVLERIDAKLGSSV